MEQNTVGHIDLHCRSIHDHRSMLQINMEEGPEAIYVVIVYFQQEPGNQSRLAEQHDHGQ